MKFSVFSFQFSGKSVTDCGFHTLKTKNLPARQSLGAGGKLKTTPRELRSRGVTVMLVIVFMGIFAVLLGSISSYVFQQGKYGRALFAREQAIHIAEAGLEYYRWFLAHNPGILNAGTGLVSPYTYAVNDPEGGVIGNATITAGANLQCGAVQWIDLTSVGRADVATVFPRTLQARYMKHSVAEYAFIFNSTVQLGATNISIGPQHANNGIRSDGWSNSVVSSAVSQVWCDSTLNCNGVPPNPSSGWKNGVFGLSSTTALWQYPVSTIDFSGMALNFATLKGYAQSSGIMLSPTSVKRAGVTQGSTFSSVGGVETKGFHLVFKSDGSVDVYRVTATNSTNSIKSYNASYATTSPYYGYPPTYPVIVTESLVANVAIPPACSLIYSEAKTWIEGTVFGKVTLIVADAGSFVPSIILNNNISYATSDGTSGLTAVAEGSVKIGLVVPDTLSIKGIFVAQTGNYSRDHYISGSGYLPSAYNQYILRTQLNLTGTVVSNQRGGVYYGTSGFSSRNNAYDRLLAFSPPPFTPTVTPDYNLVLWREQ